MLDVSLADVKHYAAEWHCSEESVRRALLLTQQRHDGHIGVAFLLAKDVEVGCDKHGTSLFDLLRNPPNDKYNQAAKRLDRVLRIDGDTKLSGGEAAPLTFETFATKHPVWNDRATSFVSPRDHNLGWVGRSQLSGLCYLHAPVVLQHYLVRMSGGDTDPGVIDMATWIRRGFTKDALHAHIFDDKGGSANAMLKQILEPGSIIVPGDVDLATQKLRQFGPALLSQFEVYSDFHRHGGKLSFDGKPSSEYVGTHAMLVVGYRREKTASGGPDKKWFLLQNWWKQLPFCEVTAEYLEHCRAAMWFVKSRQTEIPEQLPVQHTAFAESENLDRPEGVGEVDGPLWPYGVVPS